MAVWGSDEVVDKYSPPPPHVRLLLRKQFEKGASCRMSISDSQGISTLEAKDKSKHLENEKQRSQEAKCFEIELFTGLVVFYWTRRWDQLRLFQSRTVKLNLLFCFASSLFGISGKINIEDHDGRYRVGILSFVRWSMTVAATEPRSLRVFVYLCI